MKARRARAPHEATMKRLAEVLEKQLAEGAKLEKAIRASLGAQR